MLSTTLHKSTTAFALAVEEDEASSSSSHPKHVPPLSSSPTISPPNTASSSPQDTSGPDTGTSLPRRSLRLREKQEKTQKNRAVPAKSSGAAHQKNSQVLTADKPKKKKKKRRQKRPVLCRVKYILSHDIDCRSELKQRALELFLSPSTLYGLIEFSPLEQMCFIAFMDSYYYGKKRMSLLDIYAADNGKLFEFLRRYYRILLEMNEEEMEVDHRIHLAAINCILNSVPGKHPTIRLTLEFEVNEKALDLFDMCVARMDTPSIET